MDGDGEPTDDGGPKRLERDLAERLERARDYRGDVTLDLEGGGSLVGFLYAIDPAAPAGAAAGRRFVRVLPADGGDKVFVPLADVRDVRFTGRDATQAAAFTRSRELRRD